MSDGEEKYMNKEYAIELRPINEEDSELVVKWRNSTQVKQFFIYQKDISIAEQHRWIDTKVKTGKVIQFIIVEKATNKPIGSVYFRDIDYDMHKAEYGIFIGEASARGKGYGTQAAELMIAYAFEKLNLHRIYLRVLSENKQAITSYKKAGFLQEGVLKHDVFINGKYHDIIWMSIISDEYKRGKEENESVICDSML